MQLPDNLKEAIKRELSAPKARQIRNASNDLSVRYRQPTSGCAFMATEEHRLAYLAARLPATYAAVHAVLTELQQRLPGKEIHTLLDMGAGPATALWAAAESLPHLEAATLVEHDAELIALAKKMLAGNVSAAITWHNCAMQQADALAPHDLVIFSYSIGELPAEEQLPIVKKAFTLTKTALVIIEPGTPAGFERIRALRSHLISQGAHLIAPCPNALPCPMAGGDWCHFAARVERSAEHRHAKGGALGYEDEKYSYLIAAKEPINPPTARILRHPQRRSGHVHLTVCTEGKVTDKTVSRRDGDAYKLVRKMEWGDAWDVL